MTTQHANDLQQIRTFGSLSSARADAPATEAQTKTKQPVFQPLQPETQVLVVADELLAHTILLTLENSGLSADWVTTMEEGYALAASGRFPVILSQPRLPDGSWRRLIDLANRESSKLVVILVARKFDTRDWLQALQDGAFDVIDAVYGLDKVKEAVHRAMWVEYLTGAGPAPDWLYWREIGKNERAGGSPNRVQEKDFPESH